MGLFIRDIILVAIGINASLVYFAVILEDNSMMALSAVSLASLIIAMAIKAYDVLD